MSQHVTPEPGNPATEPVATAEQSHVSGRVGPPTIAQDAAAEHYVPEDVVQIAPGQIVAADTPAEGGPVEDASLTAAAEAEAAHDVDERPGAHTADPDADATSTSTSSDGTAARPSSASTT